MISYTKQLLNQNQNEKVVFTGKIFYVSCFFWSLFWIHYRFIGVCKEMYRGLDPSLPSVNIVYNYSTISKPSNWHCLQSRELIHIPLVTNALCVCVCVIDRSWGTILDTGYHIQKLKVKIHWQYLSMKKNVNNIFLNLI